MCSVACGNGTRYRQRRCNQEVPGAECQLDDEYPDGDKDTQHCNEGACPSDHSDMNESVIVIAAWSSWSTWSVCSVACGNGTRYRRRNCNQEMPNAECAHTDEYPDGNKHTEHCSGGACQSDMDMVIPIAVSASVAAVLFIAIATLCFIRKIRCWARKSTSSQEMQPLNTIGNPIPLKELRESSALSLPTSEEFDNLTSLDIRKNCLPKSKDAGNSYVRAGIPLNR